METRICTKCEDEKSLDSFARKSGRRETRCKECHNAYYRDYWKNTEAYTKHKERVRISNSLLRKERYGLTEEEYADIKNHMCECCQERPAKVPDHCHETGVLRGFLCHMCNVGIGQLGDTLEGVQLAVDYLTAHKTVWVVDF